MDRQQNHSACSHQPHRNGPEKFPFLDCLFFSFSRRRDIMHHHALITLHVFVESIIIWNKTYFYFASMVL
jgi:hypothetical protein